MKKYELTEETLVLEGTTLYRIKCLQDFGDIQCGDFGGWVEGEKNLAHLGNAWVYGDAQVYGNAWVSHGKLTRDEMVAVIAATLNVYPVGGKYVLYKRVNRTPDRETFVSLYDPKFFYRIGETLEAENPNPDPLVSCGPGIHVSTPFYFRSGDALIAVEVRTQDVLSCQEGKLRVRAVKVLEEVPQ